MDKLIYNDSQKYIEECISDAQIESGPNINNRNYLFILYSIISTRKQGKAKEVDIQAFDAKNCFDSLKLKECINDVYESGLNHDRLSLIYEGNKNSKIAVNTPGGQTTRIEIPEIVMQGSTWGSLLCSVQTDKFGKDALQREEYLYKYKDKIGIPPLIMVDDVLTVSECGIETVKVNAYINARFEQKRLELNENKCYQIHAVKQNKECLN